MKRFFISIGSVCVCLAASPALTQQPTLRPGQLEGFVTLSGRVTGSAGGGVFVIAAPRGRITVVAGGATIRHQNQLVAATVIRPGAFVRVSGTLTGSRLAAQTVDILSLPGQSNAGAAQTNTPVRRHRRVVRPPVRNRVTTPNVIVTPGLRRGQQTTTPGRVTTQAGARTTVTVPPRSSQAVRPGAARTTPAPSKQNPRGR